jgi:two-component system cell cycle response regulator
VLIVEDDFMSGGALRTILAKKGCEVDLATTLADGLRMLEHRPAYVILDLMLPDGMGTELLQCARETHPQIKIVVTTASTDSAELKKVEALKPERIFRKPIPLVDLLGAMGMI